MNPGLFRQAQESAWKKVYCTFYWQLNRLSRWSSCGSPSHLALCDYSNKLKALLISSLLWRGEHKKKNSSNSGTESCHGRGTLPYIGLLETCHLRFVLQTFREQTAEKGGICCIFHRYCQLHTMEILLVQSFQHFLWSSWRPRESLLHVWEKAQECFIKLFLRSNRSYTLEQMDPLPILTW